MFLKIELLESNGSSVTLFQLSALQRIEHLEYLKQMEAVEGGDIQAAVTLTVKSGAYLVAMSLWHGHSLKGSQGDNAAAEVAKIQDEVMPDRSFTLNSASAISSAGQVCMTSS